MYIPYGRQSIDEDDIRAVERVLRSEYLTTGPMIAEFERTVADYVGAKYAVAVSSGTAALHCACYAAGIGSGDEVITTPITFAASANCVLYCGGIPVFADIKPDSYNIDPVDIRKKITKHTKAIIAVHFTGQPCEMDEILSIAEEYGLTVIEDAAHALGADYKGRRIGSISDMTIFSFHPVKHITTGEGGMVVTNNERLYQKLLLFRAHGITRDQELMDGGFEGDWFYQQIALGYNYRISDIQCALGISQMKKVDGFIKRRKEIAAYYNEALSNCEDLVIPHQIEGCHNSWHLYVIQTENRKEVFENLRQAGIGVNVHYIPVYKHPYYQEHGYKNICCPNAEHLYERMITLPLYAGLSEGEQEYVTEELIKVVEGGAALHPRIQYRKDVTAMEGECIYEIAKRIFPIYRSITGDGVRKTLAVLKEYIPELTICEVPSGEKVFDWEIPEEWNIRGGGITAESGERILDFADHNLHIMGYSVPVDQWVDLEELKTHIYTEPSQPDVIPYVTSYYKKRFGFCMTEKQKSSLTPGRYHMVIDSEFKKGSLTYAEVILPGESKDEIFFSTYICHPSMGNNECSGPALAAYLITWLKGRAVRRYTYRFIFVPETIGSIAYLSRNLTYLQQHVIAGFNLSCVGDTGAYSIVYSKYGNTLADKVLKNILKFHTDSYLEYSFLERGSDERQYNAPGVDLPVAVFCRSKFGEYPEYHTSADDLQFISPDGFQGSFDIMTKVIMALEHNYKYKVSVLCEPQLGKRGLYPTISRKGAYDEIKMMTDFIAYADGSNDLIDISNRIDAPCNWLQQVIDKLLNNGLIQVGGMINGGGIDVCND